MTLQPITEGVHCWVCENHPDRPWGGMCCDPPTTGTICTHGACHCSAVGQPCTHTDRPEET